MNSPSDEWEVFDSAAEVFAYAHKRFGIEGVKELCDCLLAKDVPAEFFDHAARELESIGLKRIAATVATAAQNAPSEQDLCPYAEGSHNAGSWRMRFTHREQAERMRQRRTA